MKNILKSFLINAVALYVLTVIIPAFKISGGLNSFLTAGATLTLLNLLVKPILNLLLLPINLLSLGFFRWASSVLIIWMLSKLTPGLSISNYSFQGFNYNGVILPALQFSVLWTLIIGSFMMSIITTLLDWVLNE
ncbi:phage holin family protein [Candidatus Collierbacteria bacterium]|nr:phage holin family protein [Candidatus Collierbacteria bacterium]